MITFGFFASDASEPWQLGLYDPAAYIMESMLFFNSCLMVFLIAAGIFVSWMLGVAFLRFDSRVDLKADEFSHNSLLETFWTIVPAFVALFVLTPSFALVYAMGDLVSPLVLAKIAVQQATMPPWAFSEGGADNGANGAKAKKMLLRLMTALSNAVSSRGVSFAVVFDMARLCLLVRLLFGSSQTWLGLLLRFRKKRLERQKSR